MLKDVDGGSLPIQVWHGTQNNDGASKLLPASEQSGWWQLLDHDTFLNTTFNEEHPDERLETEHQLRTAYANIVYDALLHSEDKKLSDLAKQFVLKI